VDGADVGARSKKNEEGETPSLIRIESGGHLGRGSGCDADHTLSMSLYLQRAKRIMESFHRRAVMPITCRPRGAALTYRYGG
jgi:hypothetical protein